MLSLIGPMREHLDGHKELTSEKELIVLPPVKEAAIALQRGNAKIQCLVQPGDDVKIGDLIAKQDDFFYVPFFAPVSGTVKAIEKRTSLTNKPADHVIIENDGLDRKAELSTLNAEKASKEEIVAFLKEKGIIGCGGAGFPAYFKYNTDKCETLIINCVECEPFITSDAYTAEHDPEDLKYGVHALLKASGAKKCYVAVKETKKELIAVLDPLFAGEKDIEVKKVPDVYPMGWERTLVYELIGKRYERLPIEVGVILSNATTVVMSARAMKTGLPIYEKVVTVSGEAVRDPHNVLARVGTPIRELVEACGGYSAERVSLLAGGPMMGSALIKDEIAIGPASNAVTVRHPDETEAIACLRCGKCVEHCPSGLMPVNIVNALKANDVDRLIKLHTTDCIECGLCTYICPSRIAVTDNIRRAKRLLSLKAKK